jgi:hypothetical protein
MSRQCDQQPRHEVTSRFQGKGEPGCAQRHEREKGWCERGGTRLREGRNPFARSAMRGKRGGARGEEPVCAQRHEREKGWARGEANPFARRHVNI